MKIFIQFLFAFLIWDSIRDSFGYHIFRASSITDTFFLIDTITGNSNASYTDPFGVPENCYQVRAWADSVTSEPSNTACIPLPPPPPLR